MKHDLYLKIVLELIQLLARLKAFHSRIRKIIVHVQEPISSYSLKKSHFQAFHRHGNESRNNWKQEIQGIWCLKSMITRISLECSIISKNISIDKVNYA